MQLDTVLYEIESGIATVTMNRPSVLNALDAGLARDLAHALASAAKDPEVRCVVLTGAGRGFCAGADLGAVMTQGTSIPVGEILRERYHPVVEAITQMEKPVVASVNGAAAGAGASVAMACDFRIAAANAKFIQAFIKIGLAPDCGSTYFLPRLVGFAKAMELAMTGDVVTADDALRLGLVTRVVPAESLAEETRAFAATLAAGPTRAFGLTKKVLAYGATHDLGPALEFEAEVQEQLALTQDAIEGIVAFNEKRAPAYRGA